MDFSQYGIAIFAIIGLVNGANFAANREWKSFALFMAAIIAGVVFGLLHWFGLPSAEIGLLVAISSSGVYKTAQNIGGK